MSAHPGVSPENCQGWRRKGGKGKKRKKKEKRRKRRRKRKRKSHCKRWRVQCGGASLREGALRMTSEFLEDAQRPARQADSTTGHSALQLNDHRVLRMRAEVTQKRTE